MKHLARLALAVVPIPSLIAGVAHDRSEAKITVVGVPDKVGEAARIFETLAGVEVNIDMVVQNVSAAATGAATMIPKDDIASINPLSAGTVTSIVLLVPVPPSSIVSFRAVVSVLCAYSVTQSVMLELVPVV